MFNNKYKHYIKEPDLVNSSNERIDFLALEKYDFDKEVSLLNSIFLKFSDLKEKGESVDIFEKELDELIFDFHRFLNVSINGGFSGDYVFTNNSITSPLLLLEYEDEFYIKIKNINKIIECYVGDLVKSSTYNNSLQDNYSVLLETDTYAILNNFDDIINFFEKIRKNIIDISFKGFQVGYNEKEEEYRKLSYFREDYYLSETEKQKSLENQTNLGICLTETKGVESYIETFLEELKANLKISDFDYKLFYNGESNYKNGLNYKNIAKIYFKETELSLIIISSEKANYKINEDIGLYFSFKEKSVEILDFFEKLYDYRKNHLVENTKMQVNSVIDLLDVSPFNNRLKNVNITRRNLAIKEIRDNKGFIDSKSTVLAELIRDNDIIFDSQYDGVYFNQDKLKGNNNILDFIFEEEGTEFNEIELEDFKVIEILKKDGEKKYIRTDDFEAWQTNNGRRVLKYISSNIFGGITYHKVYCGEQTKNGIRFFSSIKGIKVHDVNYSKILLDLDSKANDFILENKDKFTEDSFEDHGEDFEHIPSFIGKGEFIVFDTVIKETFNKVFSEQKEIFKGYNNSIIEKYMGDIELEPVIPSIRALIYFVLENFEKINKAKGSSVLRLRSSTKVPEIDGVYSNCEDSDNDIAGEYYEVVIGHEFSYGKIDITSGSRTELIVDGEEHGSGTYILEIYRKKEGGGIHMIVE